MEIFINIQNWIIAKLIMNLQVFLKNFLDKKSPAEINRTFCAVFRADLHFCKSASAHHKIY